MHCIGKDKPLTAASWTQPEKAGRLAGVGGVLSLAFASKRRGWCDVVGLLIVALSGMLNDLKETGDRSSRSD